MILSDIPKFAAFWNHIIINGMVVSSWRRVFKPKVVEVELAPFRNLTSGEKNALKKETERYGKF